MEPRKCLQSSRRFLLIMRWQLRKVVMMCQLRWSIYSSFLEIAIFAKYFSALNSPFTVSLDRYHFDLLMSLKEALTFLMLSSPVLRYCIRELSSHLRDCSHFDFLTSLSRTKISVVLCRFQIRMKTLQMDSSKMLMGWINQGQGQEPSIISLTPLPFHMYLLCIYYHLRVYRSTDVVEIIDINKMKDISFYICEENKNVVTSSQRVLARQRDHPHSWPCLCRAD